jgi:hypothetical protein
MGGAHRAIVNGNDAVYLNPAGMSQFKRYSVEGAYSYSQERETNIGNVSIVDAVTSAVAAGLSYSYVNGQRTIQTLTPTGGYAPSKVDRTGNIVHLAASLPVNKNLLVGIEGKYLNLAYGDRTAVNAVTVDAGLLYRVSPNVSLALVGYGLTNTGSAEAPMAMAIGLAAGPSPKFRFALDLVIDFTTARYLEEIAPPRAPGTKVELHTGIEWFVMPEFAIRAGYFHDRATRISPDNAAAFGLGYFSSKSRVGFNVAFEQRFLNTDDRRFLLALNLLL